MRVDFVGHATLLIRHKHITLLSDPWWSGPAYRDSWYPFPLPVPERYDLRRVDAVYISHSHEDHLHAPTLRELLAAAPDVMAIIPLRYDTQMRDYLRRIGFRRIKEVGSGAPFMFQKGRDALRLTLITHMDDSLLSVETEGPQGEVLLNLNDALHSSRRDLILEYCRVLRGRFPRIDYLFCGFGGASYFPNCVHVPGKDDVAVARARERWFLQNFGLIAGRLKPRLAFPFAAHFVLPDERNWWISETRLGLEAPAATLRTLFPRSSAQFWDLRPGDYVEDGVVHVSASDTTASARDVVLGRYPPGNGRPALDDAGFEALVTSIQKRIAGHSDIDAVLVLTDYPSRAIRISARSAEGVAAREVERQEPKLRVETRSDLIRSTLRSPFGKDLISIGYGGQFYVRSMTDLDGAPHDRFLQALAPPSPRWRQHLRERPLRTLRFVLGDPSMRYAMARRVMRSSDSREAVGAAAPYDIRDWVAAPEC